MERASAQSEYLSAAIRLMECGAEDTKTRKALERLGATYFWRAVGGYCAPVSPGTKSGMGIAG